MKFAKQLDDEAVPEWRSKYLDYKGAKKRLKAVARALRNTHLSAGSSIRGTGPSPFSSLRDAPVRTLMRRAASGDKLQLNPASGNVKGRSRSAYPASTTSPEDAGSAASTHSRPIKVNERSPLRSNDSGPKMTRYGSIIGSPPEDGDLTLSRVATAPSLELPFPALDPSISKTGQDRTLDAEYEEPVSPTSPEMFARPSPTATVSTHPERPASEQHTGHDSRGALRSVFRNKRRTNSTPGRPLAKRMFSGIEGLGHSDDVALEQYNEFDAKNAAFRHFLDKELEKIEEFYQSKEDEAVQHLNDLRQQLHIMRDQRAREMAADQKRKFSATSNTKTGGRPSMEDEAADKPDGKRKHGLRPFGKSVDFAAGQLENAIERVRTGHVGKTSRAMGELGTPTWNAHEHDYQRKNHEVSYRSAKSSLKRALADYYRHLEYIKSYALLNRTAFRKINKKYDKTVNARPKMKYMDEKVNSSHFVSSGRIEGIIQQVEDLYARYFERGNHKLAVGKLRQKIARPGQHSGSVFRVGVLYTAGAILAIQALVYGFEQDLQGREPLSIQASYLLQIYAGYFLGVLLMTLFALDCGIFTKFKINYQLIFEFDSRHYLDWKELAEFPAACMCLLGVIMLLNFQQIGGYAMYIYWPVVLIGLTVVFLFFPAPILYHRSRKWFVTALGRLSFSGAYSIFFADFFLGDMFCSLTYAMGNIELFFCLYRWHWVDPPQCNSSHSALLGFFTTVPGIWRLLQCFRRFYDEGYSWFPHLANGGKYSFTILYYVTLSLYRRNHSWEYRTVFIIFATINAVYCSVWDLYFDWSLDVLNYAAKPPMLRPMLVFRHHKWMYYLAIPIDIIVRFNWIFYAIFTEDLQHSTAVSFFVALTEVFRRAIWVIFRVENEQCTNTLRNRAVRNAHLPYKLEYDSETHLIAPVASSTTDGHVDSERMDLEAGSTTAIPPSGSVDSLRQRRQSTLVDSPVARALKRVGTTMLTAHARDYEKKKDGPEAGHKQDDSEEDDDDDDDDGDDE